MLFRRVISTLSVALVLVALPAFGKIFPPRLEQLIKQADLIVIGRVVQVHKEREVKIAEVEIEQTIKGKISGKKIFYLATETWACDTSDAEENEVSLLFLSKFTSWPAARLFQEQGLGTVTKICNLIQDQPFFVIYYSGRGRMPFATTVPDYRQGQIIVDGVILPNSFKITRRQRPSGYAWDYERLVKYSAVHSYIKQKLTEQQSSKVSSNQSEISRGN